LTSGFQHPYHRPPEKKQCSSVKIWHDPSRLMPQHGLVPPRHEPLALRALARAAGSARVLPPQNNEIGGFTALVVAPGGRGIGEQASIKGGHASATVGKGAATCVGPRGTSKKRGAPILSLARRSHRLKKNGRAASPPLCGAGHFWAIPWPSVGSPDSHGLFLSGPHSSTRWRLASLMYSSSSRMQRENLAPTDSRYDGVGPKPGFRASTRTDPTLKELQ
jgi:hypothetical protein